MLKYLHTVISGGQTGSDVGALFVAKFCNLETRGMMPRGFKTLDGPRPEYKEMYGAMEHKSDRYPPRTEWNVENSDATLRIAYDFESAGERCTLQFIKKHHRPYFDVDILNPPDPQVVIDWLNKHEVGILNVAGNSEKTFQGMFDESAAFLMQIFSKRETNAS